MVDFCCFTFCSQAFKFRKTRRKMQLDCIDLEGVSLGSCTRRMIGWMDGRITSSCNNNCNSFNLSHACILVYCILYIHAASMCIVQATENRRYWVSKNIPGHESDPSAFLTQMLLKTLYEVLRGGV